jgi:CHAD domain-containing protein
MNPELPSPIGAYIDSRVTELRDLIPKALREFEADAIHQARVTTRRLTAAMKLLEPVLSGSHRKPFEKVLRKLRRRLGPLRDSDVILEHLNTLPECVKYPAAVSWLTEKLVADRDELRESLAGKAVVSKTLSRLGEWWGLQDEIKEAGKAIGSLLAQSLHLQLDAFAEQADRLVTQSPTANGQQQDPHELRIAGKALRYTLELAVAQGHPVPPTVIKTFKKMQDQLGHWHDMVVLSETVLTVAMKHQLPHHDAMLAGQTMEMARLTLGKSARAMAKFSAQWAAGGPDLVITIRKSFPLTRSTVEMVPTELKTDPDLPPPTEPSAEETPPPAGPEDASA